MMSPRRRDESTLTRVERRAELLATAAGVFASRGYAATSVREVADAAGMLGGSLYYHFDSKESMVDEILTAFLDDMWASYESILGSGADALRSLREIVRASFRCIDAHRSAVVIYQNESTHLEHTPRFAYLGESRRRFAEMWRSLLAGGVKEGSFRSDIDVDLAYRFIRDTVWVAASWYRPGGRLSPEEIADHYLSMVLKGIMANE
jgi:AcrR family transcriptional regulator